MNIFKMSVDLSFKKGSKNHVEPEVGVCVVVSVVTIVRVNSEDRAFVSTRSGAGRCGHFGHQRYTGRV